MLEIGSASSHFLGRLHLGNLFRPNPRSSFGAVRNWQRCVAEIELPHKIVALWWF